MNKAKKPSPRQCYCICHRKKGIYHILACCQGQCPKCRGYFKTLLKEHIKLCKIYCGIGSRSTPNHVINEMEQIGDALARKGWLLRSGGADGADSAFERGCDRVGGKKDIFLPWKGFNKNTSPLYEVTPEALELASTIHPAWFACSRGAKLLHGRNCYQVLGKQLNTPADLVICWTLDGKQRGGTRTALVLAAQYHVRVINLATDKFNIEEF